MNLELMSQIRLELSQERRRVGIESADIIPIAVKNNSSINWSAIITIIMIGELFGHETPFTGISSSPSCILPCVDNLEQVSMQTIGDAYRRYNELILDAIDCIPLTTPTVLGLSGGRDSRHILLAVGASGRALPRLVTSRHFLGNASEADVAVAQMLAARLGAPIQVVDQPRDRFRLEWDKNRSTGLQTLAHSWGGALANALDGPEILLDGMNGGILFGRSGIMNSARRQFGTKQPPFPAMWDEVRQRLADCFDQYRDYPNPIQAFQYGEHVRRGTRLFTYGMMRNEQVFCPLDTVEMVQFALTLPWEISSDPTFQEKAIAANYPEMANFPFAERVTDLPTPPTLDSQSESASWMRLKELISDHVSEEGVSILEKSRHQLGVIQKTTILGQAVYWAEHGSLPDAEAIFI